MDIFPVGWCGRYISDYHRRANRMAATHWMKILSAGIFS
jgi:hypothetical protein